MPPGGTASRVCYESATRSTPSSTRDMREDVEGAGTCSVVCAAEQLALSTQSSCGHPGGRITLTYTPDASRQSCTVQTVLARLL